MNSFRRVFAFGSSNLRRCATVSIPGRTSTQYPVETNNLSDLSAIRKLPSPPKQKHLSIALVGRPNVGKSSLFNRLTGTKSAIVSSVPGTTRDRKVGFGHLAGLPIQVVDTGGLDDRGAVSLMIQTQVQAALLSADVLLFMLDGKAGVTSLDHHFAQWLRKKLGQASVQQQQSVIDALDPLGDGRPIQDVATMKQQTKEIVLLINKTEGANLSDKMLDTISDALQLGFGEPILISATHGDGLPDLAQALITSASERCYDIGETKKRSDREEKMITNGPGQGVLSSSPQSESAQLSSSGDEGSMTENAQAPMSNAIALEDRVIQLAIMGRPNVGKSSLLNAFIGESRVIVGDTPGLTRDAIGVEWTFQDRRFRLVDTAGLTRIRTDKKLMASSLERQRQKLQNNTGSKKSFTQHEKVNLSSSENPAAVSFNNSSVIHRSPSSLALANTNVNGKININRSVELPGIHVMDPEVDPSQFSYQVSEMALISALNALRFAQVVLIVIESSQGKFSKLDLQLAQKCLEEGRAVVIAANKADLGRARGMSVNKYEEGVREHCDAFMREFGEVPIVACTALEGQGVHRVLHTVLRVHDAWSKRIHTWTLNLWLKDLLVSQAPTRHAGKTLTLKYMTQIKSRPPTFALFCNVQTIPIFFERFLRKNLQHDFELQGIPLRFVIRKSKGNDIKKSLLQNKNKVIGVGDQGIGRKRARRGAGHGSSRTVGPKRNDPKEMHRLRTARDERRRSESRKRGMVARNRK